MGRRRRGRELALQILFQVEITRDRPEEVASRFLADRDIPTQSRAFAEALTYGALEHMEEIDAYISGAAQHWRLERMAAVDRNLLRLAIFELRYHTETPPPVIIDEAIEIARKYGSEDSASFINGVLDAVRRRVEIPQNET